MSEQQGSARNQYLGVFRHLLIAIGFGAACGWTSPSIPTLQSERTPLKTGPLSDDELSWVAAIMCIGCIGGILVYGWAIDVFGRRIPGICLGIPQTISWLMIAFAPSPVYLYIARFLAGFCGGSMFMVVPIYVAEIAETRIRGFLGSFMIFAANFGVFLAFTAGAYIDYCYVPFIFAPMGVLAVMASMFFPETPVFLARRNKFRDAEDSLRFYRGLPGTGTTDGLTDELKLLKEICAETMENVEENKLTLSDFNTRPVKKAITVGIVLACLNQLTGCVAMIQYTTTIFEKTGSALSPNASTIVVGIMQIIGTYVSTVLIERAGRKVLMAASALGVAAGLFGLACTCYISAQGVDISAYSWIPFVSFCFMIFAANVGVLSLPFLILAEILPEKVRTFATTCIMLLLQVLNFLTVKLLPMMIILLDLHGTMLTFTALSTLGALYVIFFQPETKGKTAAEIMKILNK